MEKGREDYTSSCDTRQKRPDCFQGALIGPPFQEYHGSSPAISRRTIAPSPVTTVSDHLLLVHREDALICRLLNHFSYQAASVITALTQFSDHWQSVRPPAIQSHSPISRLYASGICHNAKGWVNQNKVYVAIERASFKQSKHWL